MAHDNDIPSGTGLDEVEIVVNSLYLCLGFLLKHIEETSGKDAADHARNKLIESLKTGSIDMAIFEDRKMFEFVVSIVERLPRSHRERVSG